VSKHWKPGGRPKVELKPSRIRRRVPLLAEPAADPRDEKQREIRRREREMWGGIAGVLLTAVALAVILVGTAAVTLFRNDPVAAANAARWNQCYNGDLGHCVLDGDTISSGGSRIEIAGMVAPQIQGAACATERDGGIEAAVRLADLLNSGNVTAGKPFREQTGRMVRKVKVNGTDVSETLIDAGIAREADGTKQDWCGANTAG
jgi:endonuclease YncB( thermonuclease family)